MTAAKERKLESFQREIVRTHDKLNEMVDDKQRSCLLKSEFEKILNVVEKCEKRHTKLTPSREKMHFRWSLNKTKTHTVLKISSKKSMSICRSLENPKRLAVPQQLNPYTVQD